MKQPYVLVNALAARVARDLELLNSVRRLVPSDRLGITHSPHEVDAAVRDAAAAGVDTLVIVGGDGSVTTTLTPLLRSWREGELPSLVLAGGGRRNAIARALGTRGTPDEVLARLIAEEQPPETVFRRVLRIQPAALGTRYGLTLCVGLPARWLAESTRTSGRGLAGGLFVTARVLSSALLGGQLARELAAPIEAELRVDGEPSVTESIAGLVAGTIEELGLPASPLSATPPDSDRFSFALSRAGTARAGLASALLGLGLPPIPDTIERQQVRSLELRFADRAAYAVDTDTFPATGLLSVELGPALRFLCP